MKDILIALVRGFHSAQEEGKPAKSLQLSGDASFHVPYLVALGLITVDGITDDIGVTTEGRLFCGIRPDGHMELPVEVAELTHNVEERELAARYIDGKISGVDKYILHETKPDHRETLGHIGVVLAEIAREFRMGLHLPTVKLPDARVVPYNESNDNGLKHETALRQFFADVHERNVKAGWWSEITTGEPKKRSPGELLILMVTEMAEAYEGWTQGCADDKLPQFPAFGVEMADLGIRFADFCGALLAGRIIAPDPANNPGDQMFREICEIAWRYEAIRKTPAAVGDPETAPFLAPQDVAQFTDAKLAFNAQRPDHKIEARLADDGKRT
jgi:hypothetical protein